MLLCYTYYYFILFLCFLCILYFFIINNKIMFFNWKAYPKRSQSKPPRPLYPRKPPRSQVMFTRDQNKEKASKWYQNPTQ